ncbi:MAG: response regulator [Candidatus Thorarchaeota archaeon]|nr:MAG: response regulator [Candidatus Thorarchaeota archaeon]
MKKKLMIVDDDPDILVSMRNIFEHEGFEVFTVDSGNDCIEELERGFKGVVLIDLIMPFMDGWDIIREIIKRGLTRNVVISIITARGHPDPEKMRGLESYISDYISKPFDLQQLISNINNLINKL